MKIFKIPVTLNILFDLLDKVSLVKEKYYVFEITSFNKMKFLNLYDPFIQILKEYYFPNKQHYLKPIPTLKSFMTIIKQICNYHNLNITVKKVFINGVLQSQYFIERYEFHPSHIVEEKGRIETDSMSNSEI